MKGVRGTLCSFIITANETQAAKNDLHFRLHVVTNALGSRHRRIWRFDGATLGTNFDLQPLALIAKPKEGVNGMGLFSSLSPYLETYTHSAS